ncbi:uncharacterized protein N7529_000634 [Penicillium soppii]|uniref:uncharacterized protein n=1 Tax=Penicillium soppii TaxID=69789 RepID=UPI0025495D99|nr:uncharacterized protein N7529_000634 [Penicillium soppii]KAJ5881962.1 hypothetical protein N7529_000634 [Penicillium soppii]
MWMLSDSPRTSNKKQRDWTLCGCCSSERGFEYTAEEREGIADEFKKNLDDDNPIFMVRMAEAFFLLPPMKLEEKNLLNEESHKVKRRWWKRN